MSSKKIEELRKKIDSVDAGIVHLLDERVRLAKEIGKVKDSLGLDIVTFNRHSEVLQRAKKRKKYLSNKNVENIFREIISACLSNEARIRIGFLGPRGTFSDTAAQKIFGNSLELVPYSAIDDVFRAVEKEELEYGVVPIENSTEGSVNSTLDLLLTSNLMIAGETKLKVVHNLLVKQGVKLQDIKAVYAHQQALAQCKAFLAETLPKAEKKEVSSNAKACEILDNSSAAIASESASRIYNLQILKSNIQDNANNTTRFIVLSHNDSKPTGNDKTSIVFSLKDKPGTLYNALSVFKDAGINLTKIESRPSKQKSWEYVFYVDFLGNRNEKKHAKALEELAKNSIFIKILGSYPRSSE
ncbi:prephenate dehydratase [Candidatus Micrarchaeota archaeon]|nr:prephenate dehydratase [Candidatus Micrarchaeota archaeon]